MTRWSLERRLATALAVVGALVLGVVALAALTFWAMRDTQHEVVDGYYEAVTTSGARYTLLIDAETAIRGYALTGDPAALEPLRAAQRQAGSGTGERLRGLLADDPAALAALERASASAQEWYAGWGEPTIAAVDAGGPAAVSAADVERGRELFNRVRSDYTAYIDTLTERRADAVATLDRQTAAMLAMVAAIGGVALTAVALLWLLLRRWVTRPLEDLAAQTRAVRAGDLGREVAVDGPPEVLRLSADVEDMRRTLVGQITAGRASAEELRQAREVLEAQKADLERSNRDLEQFAYVASHDLQEPLRKVASFTQLLQRRYAGQLDERADQYIEFAVDGAKRMQQLINDLLQFSRVGRLTAEQTDVELDRCLDRALRDLDARIADTGAEVTRDPLPVVRGEAPLLTQLFANLVGNALKFRSSEPPRVHVGARRDGDRWEIEVSDNGIGIEPQYAERVFVIFQRLHPKDQYTGTGIGLALCKKIVEYHGGAIAVDTARTTPGTTVRVWLPAVERADDVRQDEAPALPAVAGSTSSGGSHVL